GSDTLIGTGTQNGTTWTINFSTAGLSAGSYTLYAVATDATGQTTTASTTLTVTASVTSTSTTLTAGQVTYSPDYYTAYATLTATVTAAGGAAVDGGTVSLIYNGTTIATGTVQIVNGVGTVSFNLQMSSSPYFWYYYHFTAKYSGTSDEAA